MSLFCSVDSESHCHTIHSSLESGTVLHDFSPEFGPVAPGQLFSLSQKSTAYISPRENSIPTMARTQLSSAQFTLKHCSVCMCHKLHLNNTRLCSLIARDFALFA